MVAAARARDLCARHHPDSGPALCPRPLPRDTPRSGSTGAPPPVRCAPKVKPVSPPLGLGLVCNEARGKSAEAGEQLGLWGWSCPACATVGGGH